MRDLDGNMTRAKVDISLMQVPEFQVSNGRDLASKAAADAKAPITSAQTTLNQGIVNNNKFGAGAGAPAKPPATQPPKPKT
jgi:hypothetical protein